MATDDDDIDIILGKLQSDGHDGNNLTYIDQLKKLLQGQNDPDITNRAIQTLLDLVDAVDTQDDAETTASISSLLTLMSNAKSKTISEDLIHRLFKMLVQGVHSDPNDDKHIIARLKLFELAASKSAIFPLKGDLDPILAVLARAWTSRAQLTSVGIARLAARHTIPVTAGTLSRQSNVSQEVMGIFNASGVRTPAPRTRPLRKRDSSSSLHSSSSTTSLSSLRSTSTQSFRTRNKSADDRVLIRLEALRCLSTLAKLDAKPLHSYLPVLLAPSAETSLFDLADKDIAASVRLQAIHTIKLLLVGSKGYLDLARESNVRAAFTPLSKTVADLANEVNWRVVKLLQSAGTRNDEDFQLATLRLAVTTATVTPYGRLSPCHLDGILTATLQLIPSEATMIGQTISALGNLLKAIGIAAANTPTITWRPSTLQDLHARMHTLYCGISQSGSTSRTDSAKSWKLLQAFLLIANPPADLVPKLTDTLMHSFQTDNDDARKAMIPIYASLLPELSVEKASATARSLLITTTVDKSDVSDLQCEVCLAWLTKKGMLLTTEDLALQVSTGLRAAASSDKDARLLGYRLLNVLAGTSMGEDFIGLNAAHILQILNCLHAGATSDSNLTARAEATWSLANTIEAQVSKHSVTISGQCQPLWKSAIDSTSTSGNSRDAELIRTSSLRIIGSFTSLPEFPLEVTDALPCILTALQSTSPKMQWNAAAVSKSILEAGFAVPALIKTLVDTATRTSNVKVRMAVVNALVICETPLLQPHIIAIKQMWETIEETKDTVPFSEQARATQLQTLLKSLLERIDVL